MTILLSGLPEMRPKTVSPRCALETIIMKQVLLGPLPIEQAGKGRTSKP